MKRFSPPWLKAFCFILTLTLTITIAAGCKRLRQKAAKTDKPPIVLFVIDTLRADHVGAYGYARPTTPNLDQFAAKALRFNHAYATASWTVPSMSSLFTGVYPWDHGVTKAELVNVQEIEYQLTLNDQFQTLAEALRDAGYETFGVSGNYHMHEKYGMAQGFAHYKTFAFRDRDQVDMQVKDWLEQLRRVRQQGKPYFLYVHYFDPHHPYLAVDPFIREWLPKFDEEELKKIVLENFAEEANTGYFQKNPDKMQILIDLYDSEVKAADDSVGRWLRELPDIDQSLVVITSDHGEAFGDHDNLIHGRDLYNETLRVPLLVKFPGWKNPGAAVDTHVSLIDLYPTLAGVARAEKPTYLAGVDLIPLLQQPNPERNLFATVERADELTWRAVVGPQYKWLLNVAADRQELYDLTTDPGEKQDLRKEMPAVAEQYFTLWVKTHRTQPLYPPGNAGTIDPALRKNLKNLGYIN